MVDPIGLNKIVFPIPEEVKNQYASSLTANLFDENALALEIAPGNYRQTSSGDTYNWSLD